LPVAVFALSPADKGVSSLSVSFDASGSNGCDSPISEYNWNFGDGNMATGVNSSHQFGVGNFDVKLTVINQNGVSNAYTKSVTVKADNQNPVFNDATFTAFHQDNLQIDMSAYASDPDGDNLANRFFLVGTVNGGSLETEKGYMYASWNTGQLTYKSKDYSPSGQDTFTMRVSDGFGGMDTATITINLATHVTARNDTATTLQDQPVNIRVLDNDSSYYGEAVVLDSHTYEVVNGNAIANADGTVTFRPTTGFVGTASFKYIIYSSNPNFNGVSSAYANIDVQPKPNNDPVALSDTLTINEDATGSLDVSANDSDVDGDSFTANLVSGPQHGSATLSPSGALTYTPNANYNGSDSISYKLTDSVGNVSSVVSVAISVLSVNDNPAAGNDSSVTTEDSSVKINVLANDSDIDANDTKTITIAKTPNNGTASVNDDMSITYTPNANYNGSDSITYILTDASGGQASATISVIVTSVNDGPQAQFTSVVNGGGRVTFDAKSSSDIDGLIVSYNWQFGDGQSETITSSNTSYKYRGKGTYQVTLTVTDNQGAKSIFTKSVTL
jgi:large repetitive protein